MEVMEDIAEKIRSVSDAMGKRIYDGAAATQKATEELSAKVDASELKQRSEKEAEEIRLKLDALKKKYAALAEEKHFSHKRLLKAFPKMKSDRFGSTLERIRDKHRK